MKYPELIREIQKEKFYPTYLFHGDEELLKKEVVDKISHALVPQSKRSFNFDVLYGKETDAATILDLANMLPINSQWRIVILKEAQKLHTSHKNNLIPYLENPNPSTCLIAWATERINEKVKFYSGFKKKGCVVNFWTLFDNQIPGWINSRFKHYGKSIDGEAARLLQEYTGNHLNSLANEIEKILISVGSAKRITKKDIVKVVGFSKNETIFELTDAVGNKNVVLALQILDRLLLHGASGVYIVVMLVRHFSILWRARSLKRNMSDYELARELRQSPKNAKKFQAQSRNFSPLALANCFEELYRTDLELKSSSLDQKIVMERLIYNLCK